MTAEIETKIISYDVGGRGFGVELKYPKQFSSDIAHLLFEADKSCAQEMIRANKQPDLYFISPYGLSDRDDDLILHITANPYASSLLLPDDAFNKASCEVLLSGEISGVSLEDARYDALYGKEHEIVGKMDVAVRSLDSLMDADELPFKAPPDFLSVDTQGSECEVLRGAKKTIQASVLALTTEVEFRQMYKNQKLFPDIFSFAADSGFEFVGFTHLQEVAPQRMPIGARGADFLSHGDALFFRRRDAVEKLARSEQHLFSMNLKLAFISICYNRLSHALSILDGTFNLKPGDELLSAISQRKYFHFLKQLYGAYQRMPRRYLFSDREALLADRRRALDTRKTEKDPDELLGTNIEKPSACEIDTPTSKPFQMENSGIGTVAVPLPDDVSIATRQHGASMLGADYTPKMAPCVLRINVTANAYSETDNTAVVAIFRSGQEHPIHLEARAIRAKEYAFFNISLGIALYQPYPLNFDIRIGPSQDGAVTINYPESGAPNGPMPPVGFTIHEYSVDPKSTEVEDVLRTFEFDSLADITAGRRRNAAPFAAPISSA